MRQLTLMALAAILGTGTAAAEGYQVNTLSAKQLGMGHTGIALPLKSESLFFNPAGAGFMTETVDVSASVTGIQPTCTATLEDGREFKTDCNMSTPFNVSAAFSINPTLKAGVAIYTPYGSSIDWTRNWPGSVLTQSVDLKVFTIQPTVAWKPLPNLSVGAGLMVTWGSVDLTKGLVEPSSLDLLLAMQGIEATPFGHTSPASVTLNGTSQIALGVNIGAQYRITPSLTVGASWRSQMGMKVKAGDASVEYANALAQAALGETLDLINNANFSAEMPCPWVLGLGVAYKSIPKLTLAADARLTGWHAYRTLDIEFAAEQLQDYNQHITKAYSNSWCVSVGSQYAVTPRFDARLGLMIDTTPVNKSYYNPETPGMTKIEPTAGISFRPLKGLSVDVAFMYIHGCGVDGATCEYPDLLGKKVYGQMMSAYGPEAGAQIAAAAGFKTSQTFKADYRLHAFAPSIGISYTF